MANPTAVLIMISGDCPIDTTGLCRQFTPARVPLATRILLDNLDQGLSPLASRPSLVTLGQLAAARSLEVYLVGGSVRELALGRAAQDLDLAVSAQTLELARDLAGALGGTYVLLDEAERTARVVWQGEILDLAEFRAPTLEGDLAGRDFTLNALAVDLKRHPGAGSAGAHRPLGRPGRPGPGPAQDGGRGKFP